MTNSVSVSKSVSVNKLIATARRPHSFKKAIVSRALPKWMKLPVWDYTENLQEYNDDEAGAVIKGFLEELDATFEYDHDGFGYDCLYLKGHDILKCLDKGAYYKIPEDAEFGVETSRRQGDDGYWFYTNCPYIKKLWEDECFSKEFYSDFHSAILINRMHNCAKACSEDAAVVIKECKELYEEVKDFIVDAGDFDSFSDWYGVELTLKDGAELTFDTDIESFYERGDSDVCITETDEDGHVHQTHRDDFVDDCTGYITGLWDDVGKAYKEDDIFFDWSSPVYVDDVNDAGELYFYSLLKTALTVAKERMAKWDGIDHTVDDDEADDEAVAE